MGAVISALRETCAECCCGRDKEEISHLRQEIRFIHQGMGDIQRELRMCC